MNNGNAMIAFRAKLADRWMENRNLTFGDLRSIAGWVETGQAPPNSSLEIAAANLELDAKLLGAKSAASAVPLPDLRGNFQKNGKRVYTKRPGVLYGRASWKKTRKAAKRKSRK